MSEKSIDFVEKIAYNEKVNVSLTLEENGKSVIKCYTITDGELISPKAISSEEKLPVPSEVLESIGQEAAINNSK